MSDPPSHPAQPDDPPQPAQPGPPPGPEGAEPRPEPEPATEAETAANPVTGGPPRRVTRAADDRMLAGVAGGLGRYFSVDPIIFRLAFVVLTALGGVGIVAYLAGWLLMPVEGGEATPRSRAATIALAVVLVLVAAPLLAEPFFGWGFPLAGLLLLAGLGYLVWRVAGGPAAGDRPLVAVGLGLLVLAAALVAAALIGVAAAALGAGPLLSGLLILCGAALVAGAFAGGARWLIIPALVVALPLSLVAATGLDLDGPVGERFHRPDTVDEAREGFDIGIGEVRVDLSGVSFPPGTTRVPVEVGFGSASILVPEDVCVTSEVDMGVGYANVLGRELGGLDVAEAMAAVPSGAAPVVAIAAYVAVGEINVRSERDGFLDMPGRGPGRFGREDAWSTPEHPQLACEGIVG